MEREIVAILVDGEFYLKRAKYLWGEKTPDARADELVQYCNRHIRSHEANHEVPDKLYRILIYDCPPSDKNVFHPLHGKDVCLKKSPTYTWRNEFHTQLKKKRKVALRLGRLSNHDYYYTISPSTTKKLLNGTKKLEELTELDFINNIGQKGVDMRLGLDIQSMALKHQVTKMVLISGDSDFVPAAKQARREGIDFILDPLYAGISDDLSEHIDGLYSRCFNPHKRDPAKNPLAKNAQQYLKPQKEDCTKGTTEEESK